MNGIVGTPTLLEFISTVAISATNEGFIAKERFVENMRRDGMTRISHLGQAFKVRFLESPGKIEEPIRQTEISYHRLLFESIDVPVIAELGGEHRVETKLTHIFSLMEKQPNGENGVLHTNKKKNEGSGNIFYVRDQRGTLCDVLVTWQPDGWIVGVTDSTSVRSRWNEWEVGNQIFSLAPNPYTVPLYVSPCTP